VLSKRFLSNAEKGQKTSETFSLDSDVLQASRVAKRTATKCINYYQHLIVGVNIARRTRGGYILSLLLCACVCIGRQSSCRARVINKFARSYYYASFDRVHAYHTTSAARRLLYNNNIVVSANYYFTLQSKIAF